MMSVRTALLACLLLAACDGSPFEGGPGSDPDPTSNATVSSLPGTANPTARSDITRTEDRNKGPDGEEYGNGFAESFAYDAGNDRFSVDNLAFDGANVYTRSRAFRTVGDAGIYQAAAVYEDAQTGAQIDQFSYRALYGESRTGRTRFAIVRTGAYVPYGFGGFIFSRDGGVTLPTTGQAQYTGNYSGLRDFDGRGGMQVTSGTMQMAIDFNDFNSDEGLTGHGIQGRVENRRVFDLRGNDITGAVLAELNEDKAPDVDLTALPTLLFKVGPDVMDYNGEAEGELNSMIVASGKSEQLEGGKYYVVIAGNRADEAAGVIVVTSEVNGVNVRETGGFILYRP